MSAIQLPAELLDHIVDHLYDAHGALMSCCLVGKSWIPRTRKYLFAEIWFSTEEDLESWKKAFPDPSTSPARYAKSLSVDCPHVIMAADAEADGWIRSFSRVVHLELGGYVDESDFFLPLQGFSPAIKSLHIDCKALPSWWIFDFLLSFPLLEDLTMFNSDDVAANNEDGSNWRPTVDRPSNPPVFTGSLELMVTGEELTVRRFLCLPGGIHFRTLKLTWDHEDTSLITALVETCSHTLETLDMTCDPFSWFIRYLHLDCQLIYLFPVGSAAIDLSKARKLRDVIFRPGSLSVEWIATAFQTTTPNHRQLQKISIRLPSHLRNVNANVIKRWSPTYGQWLDLDHLLVQFWESRSTRPKVICTARVGRKWDLKRFTECLLPELARRGAVGLVD